MAGGALGYVLRVVPNQVIHTYYHPHAGKIARQWYNVLWLTRLRISALVFADLLSAFALFEMMNYLTNVWNLSATHAAGIINMFVAITSVLIIVFAFFADAVSGYLYMLVLSSIAYTIGLGLLSLSTPPFFGPCSDYVKECIGHTQKSLFYTALSFIAIGMAGHLVSLPSFIETPPEAQGETQDPAQSETQIVAQDEPEVETEHLISQLRGLMIAVVVIVAGGIAPAYINLWSIRFWIPTICTLTATVLLLTGLSQHKRSKEEGNPLKVAVRVFSAVASKEFQQASIFVEPYTADDHILERTRNFSWLDNASTKYPDQSRSKSWTLCSAREVEDTKTGILMVPMLLMLIGTGVVLSLGNTYFLAQVDHMDRKLGTIKIQIPFFLLLYTFSSSISQLIDTYALQVALQVTCIPRKYLAQIEIGIGMVLSILCCITAAIVETHRLRRVVDDSSQMSVFFLLPQIALLGGADGIMFLGFKRFLQDRSVPEPMQECLLYFRKLILGLGSMASVLWVYVVGKLSEINSSRNWFQHTLNESHLDRYYWTLTGLSAVNLVIYAIVASLDKDKDKKISSDEERK